MSEADDHKRRAFDAAAGRARAEVARLLREPNKREPAPPAQGRAIPGQLSLDGERRHKETTPEGSSSS